MLVLYCVCFEANKYSQSQINRTPRKQLSGAACAAPHVRQCVQVQQQQQQQQQPRDVNRRYIPGLQRPYDIYTIHLRGEMNAISGFRYHGLVRDGCNSALHPSGVAKSSTSFGWGKGGNVTSAGLQVTLCDPMWHVSSRSSMATLRTAIHLLLTYLLTVILILFTKNARYL